MFLCLLCAFNFSWPVKVHKGAIVMTSGRKCQVMPIHRNIVDIVLSWFYTEDAICLKPSQRSWDACEIAFMI